MTYGVQLFANNAVSLLQAPISATATSLTVMPGDGGMYPQPTGDGSDYFLVTLEDQSAQVREIVRVVQRNGDNFTVVRGREGMTPLSWSASQGHDTLVDHRVTAETLRKINNGYSNTNYPALTDLETATDYLLSRPDEGLRVTVTNPQQNDTVVYDGHEWVNASPPVVDPGTGQMQLQLYTENPIGQTTPTAQGANSVAIGNGATAVGKNSIALGAQSLSRIEGGLTYTNGRFQTQGDSQTGKYVMRTRTGNALETELYIDGANGQIRLQLQDDSTWVFEVTVIGHAEDSSARAGFRFKGVIYRVGAINTAILGTVTKETLSAAPNWNANVTADTQNNALKVSVTGVSGKIIRWFAVVETSEVTN